MSSAPKSEDDVKAKLDWIASQGYESIPPQGAEDRLKMKLKDNPLVPIGCLTTAVILGMGLVTMVKKNNKRAQLFMRLRVISQGLTVAAIMGGVVYNANRKSD